MHSRSLLQLIFLCVLGANLAAAQPDSVRIIAMNGRHVEPGPVTAQMADMDIEPVKGAPFCATVTTDHTQTFADGNRIHTTDSSAVCRDSQGRTRREASLNLLGAAPQNSAPKLITIVDPVAGFRYVLDGENKIAHRFAIHPLEAKGGLRIGQAAEAGKAGQVMFYQRVGTAGPNMVLNDNVVFKKAGRLPDEPAPATEDLGNQTIEGVHATGTRMSTTIPAGRMGNEQPIAITSERWYSPELKATIMTKHDDPWAGELKTQFTNLNTSEPDSSLFAVPTGYKVMDEKAGPFMLERHLPPLPAPPE